MKFGSAVLGSDFKGHYIYGKMEHENGFKILPPTKRIILMQIIREFLHKLIEVSHIQIGIQLPKL